MRKKIIAFMLVLTMIASVCFGENVENIDAKKNSITKKKITMTVGQKKVIKIKKNAKIKWKSSNKKVLKVNKKGKVTALKTGKCTVKVVTKNKVKKYRFNVVKSQKEEVKPTEAPKPTEIPQQEEINPTETPVPREDRPDGNLIMVGPYVVKDIIKIDDKTSYVDVGLSLDEKFRGMIVKDEEAANGVDTIRVIVDNYRIEKNQTKIGSEMRFIYTLGGTEKNIVGNICNVTRGLFAYY